MHVSRVFFKISDLVNHPLRNYRRYPNVKRKTGIVFDSRFGNATQLDCYYDPKFEKEGYSVLVNVHGGGFVCGDKKYRSGFARFCAECGYLVVNLNHRLSPKYRFPAATEDVINGLNYVADNLSKEFSLRLNQIVLTGDSAGGYYAAHAMAAIHSEKLRESLGLPAFKGEIRSLMTFCAPFHLRKVWETKAPLRVPADVANCVLGTRLKKVDKDTVLPYNEEQNILNYVNGTWKECFLLAADRDSFCGGQVDGMADKLRENGIPYRLYRAQEKGDSHCTHLLPFLKGSKKEMAEVKKYLTDLRNR